MDCEESLLNRLRHHDLSELAVLESADPIFEMLASVHDDWPVFGNRFVQRRTGKNDEVAIFVRDETDRCRALCKVLIQSHTHCVAGHQMPHLAPDFYP